MRRRRATKARARRRSRRPSSRTSATATGCSPRSPTSIRRPHHRRARVVKSGKEATVYCCVAHPPPVRPPCGEDLPPAHVPQPAQRRRLPRSRTAARRSWRGPQGRRRGQARAARAGARAGRITAWIAYEFDTQRLLHAGRRRCAAPRRADRQRALDGIRRRARRGRRRRCARRIPRARRPGRSRRLLRNIELFLAHDRIHGDLSAYNILYWGGRRRSSTSLRRSIRATAPTFIDLLARDIERVCRHFARYGVEADADALAGEMWEPLPARRAVERIQREGARGCTSRQKRRALLGAPSPSEYTPNGPAAASSNRLMAFSPVMRHATSTRCACRRAFKKGGAGDMRRATWGETREEE